MPMSPKSKAISSGLPVLAAFALLGPLTAGCGESPTEVSQREGELTDPCLDAQWDRLLGRFDPEPTQSPTTYSNPTCPKNFIFQTVAPLQRGDELSIGWTDMRPRTFDECNLARLNMQIAIQGPNDTVPWEKAAIVKGPLMWDELRQSCLYPRFVIEASNQAAVKIQYINSKTGGIVSSSSKPVESLAGFFLKLRTNALTPRGSTQSVSGWIIKRF